MKPIHSQKYLLPLRRKLRKNLTPAEAFLWTHLKGKKLQGRKFQRQHSIGNYIVDFYCASEQLIIELDGEVHFNAAAQEKDNIRTEYLESLGYTVIRFENKLVFDQLPTVLSEIESHFKV
ncbi:endonuclease domain-containing protein [Flagellimonas allohymeniacidonis]|uniref:DUF559 domain-containing protein n=1 Tax=Flagellimonas allohymeniacidonis TaxID=2517819 RepID=A0A4Q8QJX4_9FLAO|nr:endonuclease domain-containing protein [Allomuricauda hymeniacidonis]TAI49638.1 DUF559 domain-containing protein [Allomuricauda hymeniacidonis]